MTLVRFDKVSLEFGDNPLLTEADLAIEPGELVCLIGRNGAGKTSLLRLIMGTVQPDPGEIECKSGLRISQLAQHLQTMSRGKPFSHRERVTRYAALCSSRRGHACQ